MMDSTATMEEAAIRLENLKLVCAARGLDAKALADRFTGRYTYWRDLLAGNKSFGEKVARRIEEDLQLPPKWLDEPHDGRAEVPSTASDGLLPLCDGEPDLIAAFRLLDQSDRDSVMRQVAELVAKKNATTMALMARLNVTTRADDARVNRQLPKAPALVPKSKAVKP